MQTEIHSIHHVNFPTTDKERTKEWYSKVFGMVQDDVSHLSNTPVLLMTTGKCDRHFTPVKEMKRMWPFHFAIEVEDWDRFIAKLEALGIEYTMSRVRPQNDSKTARIQDPDGTLIEVTYHEAWHKK